MNLLKVSIERCQQWCTDKNPPGHKPPDHFWTAWTKTPRPKNQSGQKPPKPKINYYNY